MIRATILCGNPRPGSRTLGVARAALAAIVADAETRIVDLAEHGGEVLAASSSQMDELLDAVGSCDLLLVATPTYKASYTGLLKAFLDRFGASGLAGVVAVPVMTGGSLAHALAVEVHLRPVLLELGATVPSSGLFVVVGGEVDPDPVIEAWAARSADAVRRALPPRSGG